MQISKSYTHNFKALVLDINFKNHFFKFPTKSNIPTIIRYQSKPHKNHQTTTFISNTHCYKKDNENTLQ